MSALTALLPVFTLDDARAAQVPKRTVYDLIDKGLIERVGRGVFLRVGEVDPAYAQLAGASAVRPEATLCLTSALVQHELSDEIPLTVDIALPRSTRHPAGFAHVVWHSFQGETFSVGRERLQVADRLHAAVYSAERTIVDCFRLMHREGSEVAHEALRRWLRHGGSPAGLVAVARSFPAALPRLRTALEVLL